MNGKEYNEMIGAPLPYITEWGFTMTEIGVECPTCETPVDGEKFNIAEFTNSVDINGVGVCKKCDSIVSSKPLRVYRDGRVSWRNADGYWVIRVAPFKEKLWGLVIKVKKCLSF